MSDNFDEVNSEEQVNRNRRRKSRSARETKEAYDRTRKLIDNVRRNSGTHTSSGTSAGSSGTSGGGGAAAGGSSAGGTAAGGTAGGGAAGGAATGGAAAGGAAAGGAAAGGAASGGAAAGGAATGGALAGLAAIAWPVILTMIIIAVIIVIILLLMGAVTFFTTVPGMMIDKITEISSGLWRGFKSFFEGNAAYITVEDQTTLAEYIENMGYDVVGYGFASSEELQTTTTNTETGVEENIQVKSKYLLSYLLADYNTYALDSPVKQTISNFWSFIWGADRAPLTGMLKFDDYHLIDNAYIEIDRDKKAVTITVWNPELEWLNVLNEDTYTYSLDGWTGRYGKPLEFLLTLHLSTMAPDLAYHVASDKEFDTKVHINFKDMEAYLKLQYVVNSGTISSIESEDFEGIRLWEIDGLEYLEDKIAADGALTLSATDLENINDKMSTLTEDDEDVVNAIDAIGMSPESLKDAVGLCQEHMGRGKQLLSKQPYISYVEKAWYKNVYFIIDDEIRKSVSNDDYLKTAPDFTAYEDKDAGMVESAPYDFHPSSDSDQANIVSDTSKGTYQVLESRQSVQISQKSEPLKGSTNPRIKELFVGAGNDNIEGQNPKPEYYIYDGSRETAQAIDELRKKENEYRASGYHTEAQVSEYINSIDEHDLYRPIDFNKNSLTALAILENMQTEDADSILRDFKSLLIELKYFKTSDLADKYVSLLDWIIPDYVPADWPNRKYEKQNYEYGTYILSKKSVEEIKAEDPEAFSKGNTSSGGSSSGGSITSRVDSLDGFLFIGDSFTANVSGNIPSNCQVRAKGSTTPQQWLEGTGVEALPTSGVNGVCVLLGVNAPTQINEMKQYIQKLRDTYPSAPIYVQKVFPVGSGYSYTGPYGTLTASQMNSDIANYNSQIASYCSSLSNVKFIDTTAGFVDSQGYLSASATSDNLHLNSSSNSKWMDNIKSKIVGTSGSNSQEGGNATAGGNGSAVTNAEVQENSESGDGYSSVTEINGVRYRNYKQHAGSYAETEFDGGTIHSMGCGPTSAAIVASGYGKLEANPRAMADKVPSRTLDGLKTALESFGITSTVKRITSSDTQKAADDIRQSFSEGKPVIVLMGETLNSSRPARKFTGGGHFMTLLGEENGTLIISNPCKDNKEGNRDELGLEAFIRDYITENQKPGTAADKGYLIFDEAPDGANVMGSVGFEPGMKVITPGIGEVTKVSENSITIKFTEVNLVKDMTMTISGFTVDTSITVGTMLNKEQEIGVTTEEDILVILRAPNKSVIENVEDYMPSPNMEMGGQAYNGELTDDEFEFFAAVLYAENGGASVEEIAQVGHVTKNMTLSSHMNYNTIPEVLVQPKAYQPVVRVPGTGTGTVGAPAGGERNPPAGRRTYKIEGFGEYWVNSDTGEPSDKSREAARGVLDGTIPDTISPQLGRPALFQVGYDYFVNELGYHPHLDHCVVTDNGILYAHLWCCIEGKPEYDCSCSYP